MPHCRLNENCPALAWLAAPYDYNCTNPPLQSQNSLVPFRSRTLLNNTTPINPSRLLLAHHDEPNTNSSSGFTIIPLSSPVSVPCRCIQPSPHQETLLPPHSPSPPNASGNLLPLAQPTGRLRRCAIKHASPSTFRTESLRVATLRTDLPAAGSTQDDTKLSHHHCRSSEVTTVSQCNHFTTLGNFSKWHRPPVTA